MSDSQPETDGGVEAATDRKEKLDPKEIFRIEKKRINWIDQARGFVMFMLVFSALMPGDWREANMFTRFFLEHPAGSTTAEYMNFYDIGVPAFFFIIGLLMAVSFQKRREKLGTQPAVMNAFLRWAMILGVGILFMVVSSVLSGDPIFGEVKDIIDGPGELNVYVVYWDVVPALGYVGLATIPFLFIPKTYRLIISYAMMGFYQVMIFANDFTHWRDYAIHSVHGGIIGGFLVLLPITLIASVIGEHFILGKGESKSKYSKNQQLGLLGIANLVIGVVLWLIPGGFPSKRQSTMGWATISLSVCILFAFIFIWTDYKDEDFDNLNPLNKGRIVLFKSYGMNPFLVYAIAEVTMVVVEALIGDDFVIQLGLFLILTPVITVIVIALYKAGKAISTTKVAAGIMIIVVGLAVVLIPFL
ncbi:MAG: hypothetical protein ACTSUE_02255 [Promethearchaeota archaeon]